MYVQNDFKAIHPIMVGINEGVNNSLHTSKCCHMIDYNKKKSNVD